MPSRVVVSGIVLVVFIAFIVCIVEFFTPISMKSDMNIFCRNVIMKMEVEGGLSGAVKAELIEKMSKRGFKNILVTGPGSAKWGEEITLHVEADYEYRRLTAFFRRATVVQRMVYNKTLIARKVVN